LQDFGDCNQSSQIGPHLVQPLRRRLMAKTPKISANRLNMIYVLPPTRPIIRSKVWHFQAAGGAGRFAGVRPGTGIVSYPVARNNTACKTKPAEAKSEAFDIEEARRVPGDVSAPWVQDLGLSTDSVELMCWPMARAVRLARTMSFGPEINR
jgi:hypothetical protein